MDGFGKPFEYEEDKVGGLLLVFFVMLISFELLYGIVISIQIFSAFKDIYIVRNILLVLCIMYMISILFTAISLYKIQRYLIKIAKIFLIVRLIFLTICHIIITINGLNNNVKFGNSIFLLLYVIIFSVSWYVYFIKSKKCKEFIKNK
jgi:hypothetical protein